MKDIFAMLHKTSIALFILCVSCSTLFAQGQLTPPPGPPGQTMKTLDQMDTHISQSGEKRTDIKSLAGDKQYTAIINQPGSYYLSSNLSINTQFGIHVLSEGVIIDLNGYTVTTTSADAGFVVEDNATGCTIKNGAITGFEFGVNCQNGTTPSPEGYGVTARGGAMLHVAVSRCWHIGAIVGEGWVVDSCAFEGNGDPTRFADGLVAHESTTVVNCQFRYNSGVGIAALPNCVISHCTVGANAGGGISADYGCHITDCTASYNGANGIETAGGSTVTDCTLQRNKGDGIHVADGCTVHRCTANDNAGAGINTGIRAEVTGCNAIGNKGDGIGFGGDSFVLNNHASKSGGAGFHDFGSASRIDGNVSRENIGIGILASSADTVVRNNSGANGNGATNNQYGPTAGPNWGPVGVGSTATSPWANF
jgi:hypothetical protein